MDSSQTCPRADVLALNGVESDLSRAVFEKSTREWQMALWRQWPREEDWPVRMDVYESAAYLRLSPDTIRRALTLARDGRAKLAHQRVGATYRIRKYDLDSYGKVNAR